MGAHDKGPFRRARICDCGDHGFVGLTIGLTALFSTEDLPLVQDRNWNVLGCAGGPYARAFLVNTSVLMHRLLAGAGRGEVVDHRHHDTLDNRRSEIRLCSASQNLKNKRPRRGRALPKGVYPSRDNGFVAQICSNGRRVNLGTFPTLQHAAAAYDAAAASLHGEFANTNLQNEEPK